MKMDLNNEEKKINLQAWTVIFSVWIKSFFLTSLLTVIQIHKLIFLIIFVKI